jgi:hypothetical protein
MKCLNSIFNAYNNYLPLQDDIFTNTDKVIKTVSQNLLKQDDVNYARIDSEIMKKHKDNIKISKKFVKLIWACCDIFDRNESDLEYVANKIIEYDNLTFSNLFLAIAKHSADIGTCTTNSIILFGRGVAYLGDLCASLYYKCNDSGTIECPAHDLNDSVRKNLKMSQIYNFLSYKLFNTFPKCE